ncbi:hypothetical protein LDENG_00181490 [Lucifuga dentata]|nr:hypothetical protein LDENG_00181490 [Lucifuga dentata]
MNKGDVIKNVKRRRRRRTANTDMQILMDGWMMESFILFRGAKRVTLKDGVSRQNKLDVSGAQIYLIFVLIFLQLILKTALFSFSNFLFQNNNWKTAHFTKTSRDFIGKDMMPMQTVPFQYYSGHFQLVIFYVQSMHKEIAKINFKFKWLEMQQNLCHIAIYIYQYRSIF